MYIHTYIHAYIYTYMHTYIHAHTYKYIFTHREIHTHTTHTHTHTTCCIMHTRRAELPACECRSKHAQGQVIQAKHHGRGARHVNPGLGKQRAGREDEDNVKDRMDRVRADLGEGGRGRHVVCEAADRAHLATLCVCVRACMNECIDTYIHTYIRRCYTSRERYRKI